MRRISTGCIAALALSLGACGPKTNQVSSQYVVTQQVTASKGGTIQVTQQAATQAGGSANSIVGAAVVIPPGALSTDTTITITVSQKPVITGTETAAGQAVEFGPDGTTFLSPVTVTVPFKLLPGQTIADLGVAGLESNGTHLTFTPSQTTVSGNLASVQVNGFTAFGAFTHPPPVVDAGSSCPTGDSLTNGYCSGTCQVAINCACDDRTTPTAICPADVNQACAALCTGHGGVVPVTDAGQVCANGTDCASGACCNGTCLDTTSDPNNCGACGSACAAGEACNNGVCQSSGACTDDSQCPSPQVCQAGQCTTVAPVDSGPATCQVQGSDCGHGGVCCNGTCFDPNLDPSNCGGCGVQCASGATCNNGVCQGGSTCTVDTDCASGEECVNGTCVANAIDAGPPQECGGAVCVAGDVCCGTTCVDIQADPNNCGLCGISCPGGDTCNSGVCQAPSCTTDSQCAAGQTCSSGVCATTPCRTNGDCPSGSACDTIYDICVASYPDGGLVDAGPPDAGNADGGACPASYTLVQGYCSGACDIEVGCDCADGTMTGAICPLSAGLACGVLCQSHGGVAPVDAGPANTCSSGTQCAAGELCCGDVCSNTQSDPSNCGGCGTACPSGEACGAGVCGLACQSDADCRGTGTCNSGVCS